MIDIHLRYQASLFGAIEDISPKPEILKYFIDAFSDKQLIPTTFQEIGIAGVLTRLTLNSSDEVWRIEFATNRIDIIKTNKNVGITDMKGLADFAVDVKNIAKSINEKFQKKYNRLSIVTRYLLKEMSQEEMTIISRKVFNTIDLYRENVQVDWKNRVVARIPLKLKSDELTNVISEINRLKGNLIFNSKPQRIDRIELNFDINTFQGNNDFRFDLDDLGQFIDEALKMENTLVNGYLKLIS